MNGSLVFGFLITLAVLIAFVGLWRSLPAEDAVEARLHKYGLLGEPIPDAGTVSQTARRRRGGAVITRLLAGFGPGSRLALALARADLPFTAAEFIMITLSIAFVGFLIGTIRLGPLPGLLFAGVFGYLPLFYLQSAQRRRLRAITEQLPDVLTLLVGGLRAGYGLVQTLNMVISQLPPPVSTEFVRVVRAIGLGLSVQQALSEMADRLGTEDMDLVVTAINVQYEMGGNLAQTLDIISETVRDRIRILREIRVLTAQQRLTGYVLAALPVIVAILLFVMNPGYMSRLFEPGWVRFLPVVAGIMVLAGFLVIGRILDIEV